MPRKTKKTDNVTKDILGFRKKDYPLLIAVALIAVTLMAFNAHNTLFILGAIALDLLGVYWLYRRFTRGKNGGK